MPKKLVLIFTFLTCLLAYGQELKDSVWVSVYTNQSKSDSLLLPSYKYSKLYNKVYKLPVYSDDELQEFYKKPLAHSLKDLLKLTSLEESYSPDEIKGTSLEKYLKTFEQFTHPFSSVITSSLAQELELENSQPELIANNGELFLKSNKKDLLSTDQMLDSNFRYDSVAIDQQKYLRYRLLDLLVGSYSKTKENISWVERKEDKQIAIEPYVNFYDNQFMKLEKGYKLFSKLLPSYQHFESYENRIANIKKVTKPLFGFDVNILSTLKKEDWGQEVSFIQERLNPLFIQELINKLPKPARTEASKELLISLEERITNLDVIADEYYQLLSAYKVITASLNNDIIVVDRNKEFVKVNIFNEKKGKNSTPEQSYSFSVKETKAIWIYGLKGNDYFEVKGEPSSVSIDLIGGKHLDKFEITDGRGVEVFDEQQQTLVVQKDKAKLYLSNETYLQEYNSEKHIHTKRKKKPLFGANPDDGIFVGAAGIVEVNKFKRNPVTQFHELEGIFYTGTSGFKVGYYGELANVIKQNNAFASVSFQSPNYSTNFFGFGNETPNFDDNLTLDYNRIKMAVIHTELGLKRSTKAYEASASLFYERVTIDKTPDRFVSSATLFFPDEDFFDAQNYVGGKALFSYKTLEFDWLPELVLEPVFKGVISVNTNDTQQTISKIEPQLLVEHPLYDDTVWLDVTLSYQQVFGKDFEFYQAAYLGGNNGLRGYRNQRFTGKSAFAISTDVKWFVKEIKSEVLPLQFGLLGGFDAGRVWLKDDESSKIHTSYGSGFWLQSANLVMGSLQVFGSDEGLRFNFNLSFGF